MYKEIIKDVQNEFGEVNYFNDKRKTFRRIKFYTPKSKLVKIEKFLKKKYGNVIIEIQNNTIELGISNPAAYYYSGLCVKLPLEK